MSKFAIGDKIKNANTGEVGYIIKVYDPFRGRQLYRVKYDDRENDETSRILVPDIDLTDPFERCGENYFSHFTEYLKVNTTFKIRSSNNSTVSSLKASRTLFRPYQFKPLLKFLNSDDRRLLIADEVGLGKTIEAGHIMLELKARGELHNVLVVCPMSLKRKWATELTEKFGLDFIEIGDKDELIMELQHHNGNVRAVINYDKIRTDSDIINFIEQQGIKFSLVVCDESHKLRNNGTLIYRGATKLMLFADSAVFMSATPIMINIDNLYNQLHLLDPNLYDNPEVFRNNVNLNHPFVAAMSQLNAGGSLIKIADELQNAEVTTHNTINDIDNTQDYFIKDYFKDYPVYQEIVTDLTSGEDTPAIRARIQYNLSEMSPMNSIFSRTRKREVTQDWSQAERNPKTVPVSLTEKEKIEYDLAIEGYIDDHTTYDEYGREHSGQMGLVTLKRQLASSVWGTCNEDDDLSRGIDAFSDEKDAKFEELLKILKTVFSRGQKKIIVFAIFKKTLKYLNIRLENAGYKCAVIYGDSSINKFEVLDRFQHDDKIQVLLSSEVGSEGLDMQFCNSMVNYDLPWNPMVVEQRIGRIDRFGQESPKVNIYTIVVKDSILEEIYSRLLIRIGIFKESIGDLEAILDANMEQDGKTLTIKEAMKNMERDFYSDKLSEEEVKKKQADINRAIETEKLHLQDIEQGLTNTLTNDSYFRDEINKIVRNNAYVTAKELYFFISQLIKEKLTTCSLVESEEKDIYIFKIPKSQPKVLINFLEQYQPISQENHKIFGKYIRDIDGELELYLTFNQEKAFRDKRLSYVNIYHPIVLAAEKYFEDNTDKGECTFFFGINRNYLPTNIVADKYMLAIYKITVSRKLFGHPHATESLYPILYDLSSGELVDNHELTETFMGAVQENGEYIPFDESYKLNNDMLTDLRYGLKDCVDEYVTNYREDLDMRIKNSRKMRYEQTVQYYQSREQNWQRSITNQEVLRYYAQELNDSEALKNAENTLRLLNARLRELRQQKDAALQRLQSDPELKVTDDIMSLSYIQVI